MLVSGRVCGMCPSWFRRESITRGPLIAGPLGQVNVHTCRHLTAHRNADISRPANDRNQRSVFHTLSLAQKHGQLNFGAFCLDVRILTFCQLMGFSLDY